MNPVPGAFGGIWKGGDFPPDAASLGSSTNTRSRLIQTCDKVKE